MATSAETAKRTAKFDSPQQEVYLNLWRTYDRLRLLEDRLFQEVDLSCQQYNVLRLLKAARPSSLPTLTIAGRLVSRAPDITRILDKLEDRGLLTRSRGVDNRRQVLVDISQEGLRLLKSLERPLQECHEQQLGHLNATDMKRLCELLKAARQPHEDPDSPWSKQ